MRNGNERGNNRNDNIVSVLILPMRNGNDIKERSISLIIIVLILPMRNGNNLDIAVSHVA